MKRLPLGTPTSRRSNSAYPQWSLRFAVNFILLVCVFLSSLPCRAQSATSFGTNVSPTLYYNQDGMFTDLFLHCTGWWQNDGTTFTTGPDGMITSGHAQNLIEMGGYQSGTYQFYGEGAFTIDFRGAVGNNAVPGTLQTVNNVTTCLVTINVPDAVIPTGASGYANQSEILVDVNVTDPTNPPKNFHLIAPGNPAYPNNPMFGSQFLKALAPFSCMRFMDYMSTNIGYGAPSTPVTWANRPKDGVFGYANAGQSYEKMIQLANTACKDIWINIPCYATDDWATGMAQLIKTNLNPKLHVYYEFCNENWNWGFGQWQVVENWDVTNTALTTDAAWARHGQEMAFLLMHFRNIMQPILGDQGRPIFAGQAGGGYTTDGLAFIQAIYGPPNQYFWGMASAPYFGPANNDTDLDSLFTDTITNITSGSWNQSLQNDFNLAKKYSLNYCCYESGQGLSFSDLATAAQQDPRMGTAYLAMGNVLIQNGTALCNFYDFIGDWGQYGYWGALTDVREIDTTPTVKYAAEAQLALGGPACNCSTSSKSSHNNFSKMPTATPMMTKVQLQAWAAQLAARNAAKAAAAAAAAAAKHNVAPTSSASSASGMNKSQMQTWAAQLAAKNAAKAAATKKHHS